MALILHLDTSASIGIAMLSQDGCLLSIKYSQGERDHAGNINRLINEVLEEAGKKIADIEAIAVCNGPGSYTGLRIGLATAKGLCYVLERPLILHSRLNLMLREAENQAPDKMYFLALLPARIGEYYAAGNSSAGFSFAPTHLSKDELVSFIESKIENIVIVGMIHDDIHELVSDRGIKLIHHEVLDFYSWAIVAHDDFNNKEFADLAYSEPQYLKQVYITSRRDV